AVAAVQKLCLDVGLPEFRSLNVPVESFERIAEISARNISTESNPRPMKVEDYMAVLMKANEAK
ncbi:MAG: NAD-dependent alcohol dehydrogenase, partial [Clostridia bacterium]|nr:NAD-dependent alcohol dehydrogenase [Clostridia bacterium]